MRRPTTPTRAASASVANRHDAVRPSGRQVGLGGHLRHRDQARHAEPGQPDRRLLQLRRRRLGVSARQQPGEPRPLWQRQRDCVRCRSPMRSYINGSSLEQTTAWTVGAGFEYFWTRNFSSTIYGNYTEVSYNNTVIDQPLVLQRRQCAVSRSVCGGDLRSGLQVLDGRHASRLVPAAGSAVCGRRDVHRRRVGNVGQTVTLGTKRRRSSDRCLHRQGPGHHLGHLPRSAHLGRRLSHNTQGPRR